MLNIIIIIIIIIKRPRIFVRDHVCEICKPNHITRFILKIFF